MFSRNTVSSLSLSQKQLIFISWAWTHKDKTVIPEILAPMDRKTPMSFSKLSTVGGKKKYAKGWQTESVATIFMQNLSEFNRCVSWNVKYLCWMGLITVWIFLVRLSVPVHFRQAITRAARHRPFSMPGGPGTNALLRGQLCSSHTDSDSRDRLCSGWEPHQPHQSWASRTERFTLEGSHTKGCEG